MIHSAEIQNFRGFKNVSLSGLSRINVVVGDNGAGKTAFLEALFFAVVGNPEVAIRLRNWRGVDTIGGSGTPQDIYDGMFLSLFHEFRKTCIPSISVSGEKGESRALRFYYDVGDQGMTVLPLGSSAQGRASPPYTPIVFEWTGADGSSNRVTPIIQGQNLLVPPSPQQAKDAAFLAARTPIPTSQNVKWFSDLSVWGKESRFVATVQSQFPDFESFSVEVEMGHPAIFVKSRWINRKIPLYLASDGLNKLVTLLLHIAHCEGSVFLCDEVENGFHFSRHEKLWHQLHEFAVEYNTQLFFSTHSWEFLQSLVPAMKANANDYSLVQIYSEDGECKSRIIQGGDAVAAISSGLEIRR